MNEATYLSFGGTRGGLAIDYMVPELLVSQSGEPSSGSEQIPCACRALTDNGAVSAG